MAGLKRVIEQPKFHRKCEKVADQVGISVDFDTDKREDDAFEDNGCLHVRRYELRAMFGIGQDTDGKEANEKIRTILAAVGMKRKIGPRTLVDEECEECNGEGTNVCELGCEHPCDNCGGNGLVPPDELETKK